MSLSDAMQNVLATTYALALKTQNAHWNVTGMHFHDLHVLFEEQYTEMHAAIDDIAENIRQLGVKVPASFGVFDKNSPLPAGDENADTLTMVKGLAASQKSLLDMLQAATTLAGDVNDDVIEDFLIGRMAAHKKQLWMLESIAAS